MHNQEASSASIFSGFCMLCIFPKAHALCGFIVAHLAIHLKVIGFVLFCPSLFGEKSICMPGSCLISQQFFWGFAMKILNVNENCYDIAKSSRA